MKPPVDTELFLPVIQLDSFVIDLLMFHVNLHSILDAKKHAVVHRTPHDAMFMCCARLFVSPSYDLDEPYDFPEPKMRTQLIRRTSHAIASMATQSSATSLKKTPLYGLHQKLDGKMVDFAGYLMPVQYPAGIVKSHLHTRSPGMASLFDVSHMGQLRITGRDRVRFLESLIVGDIESLNAGEAKLSLITNEHGGIIDDCVITKYDDHLYMVINAGNQDIDIAHMNSHLKNNFQGDVKLERLSDRALVALQGPGAAEILAPLVPSVQMNDLEFMNGLYTTIPTLNMDGILTRCGYTGEDGFEISVPSNKAEKFVSSLLADKRVLEAGLGARDSLRLEAGLCLHGHDITSGTTPIEAALAWTIGKRRREEGGFPGHEIIMDQLQNKTFKQKRVGFSVEGAAAREGTPIYDERDQVVGKVTSGTFSPSLKKGIGMAYLDKAVSKIGRELHVKARKEQKLTLAKMPFVPAQYYKKA